MNGEVIGYFVISAVGIIKHVEVHPLQSNGFQHPEQQLTRLYDARRVCESHAQNRGDVIVELVEGMRLRWMPLPAPPIA